MPSPAWWPTSGSCSGSPSTPSTVAAGSRPRCSRECSPKPSPLGVDRLLLEVREDNAGAVVFYEKHGFVELDRRPGYYRDGATAIVMQRVIGMGP